MLNSSMVALRADYLLGKSLLGGYRITSAEVLTDPTIVVFVKLHLLSLERSCPESPLLLGRSRQHPRLRSQQAIL